MHLAPLERESNSLLDKRQLQRNPSGVKYPHCMVTDMDTGRLSGKISIVTGSASGIGRAIAQLFAKEGATVIVVDINAKGGGETVDLIEREKGKARFIHASVLDTDEIKGMVGEIISTYGRIDVLHNNAGGWQVEQHDTVIENNEGEWDKLIDLNLKSVYRVSREVLPQMIKQGGGAIVNTVTINAFLTQPGSAAYSAAKAGLYQLTKAMALDYAKHKIRVNGIAPGEILTPLWLASYNSLPNAEQVKDSVRRRIPMGRFGEPEEVAFAALWLASDEARYVTGEIITVDGGISAGVYP
jgi:NAD(P)-dependent dehydrogenase (short-subunit alcohol dehydrogenase family)